MGFPAAPWGPALCGGAPNEGDGFMLNCGGGAPGSAPFAILSAETQPELLISASIFLRRISSTISDILIHRRPIGSGWSLGLS